MKTFEYHIGFSVKPKWFVAYHIEHEEIFIYSINDEDIISVFSRGGLDSMGFIEYMKFDHVEILGEL